MHNKRFNNITIDSKHIHVLPNPGGRFYSLEKLRRLYLILQSHEFKVIQIDT